MAPFYHSHCCCNGRVSAPLFFAFNSSLRNFINSTFLLLTFIKSRLLFLLIFLWVLHPMPLIQHWWWLANGLRCLLSSSDLLLPFLSWLTTPKGRATYFTSRPTDPESLLLYYPKHPVLPYQTHNLLRYCFFLLWCDDTKYQTLWKRALKSIIYMNFYIVVTLLLISQFYCYLW